MRHSLNPQLLLVIVSLAFAGGCNKKPKAETTAADTGAAEAPAAPQKKEAPAPAQMEVKTKGALPGAVDVRSALASKDWVGAVERLVALKGLAVGDAAWLEYRALNNEVGEQVQDASAKDPKAAEALAMFRANLTGR